MLRVVHIITRMIQGGAQENTLLTVQGLHGRFRDATTLITGPPLGPEGSLIEKSRAGGLDVRIVDALRRELHPIRDWKSYTRLVSLLRELQPQIVHTHSSKAGIIGRAAAAKVGVPVIVHTVHGSPFHRYERWHRNLMYRATERWAARKSSALVTVCDAMADQYVAADIAPAHKFITIYSGMDVDSFEHPERNRTELRAELGYDDSHIVVGKIARLFELKGHDDVIEVASELVRRFPEVRFLFVGDGLRRAELQRKVDELGLTSFFQFTGLVDSGRVPAMIHAMDVVVHCSFREGLARVLPQALIAQRPVVSYDVDGAREVVLSGETGFLVPPHDLEQLAGSLSKLCEDKALRHRLGAQGHQRFKEQFRHEKMTEQIRNLYVKLLPDECLHNTSSDDAE